MAAYADRVKDTTTSTGTGAITLAGSAPSGFRTFAAAFGASSVSVAYCIAAGSEWEVGEGTFDGTTGLTRDTVLGSSNSGSLVSFSAGTKDVFCTLPASRTSDQSAHITTSEALAAGDFVNIWDSAGAKARKADATVEGKEADGYVLAAFGSGASALVYFSGVNTKVSGQTPGQVYLQTTAGAAGTAAPTGSGNVQQSVGVALSATSVLFKRGDPVTLA